MSCSELTDSIVERLLRPKVGNKIYYDSMVKGFGCRVTMAGARSFVLNYRTEVGRERRYTIGSYPDWSVGQARNRAAELKRSIDMGGDPQGDRETKRMKWRDR